MTGKTISLDESNQDEPEESPDEDSEKENYQDDDDGRHKSEDRIMYASPRVSIEENDIPIIVRNKTSFEERILEASPDIGVPVTLSPCNNCGRKFNQSALERHVKVCQKVSSKPKKIFDAVNKLWKSDAEVEQEKQRVVKPKKTAVKKKSIKPEDKYQECEFCQRRFCDNAFDRHVEFCKEKSTRLQTSPSRDPEAIAKLVARTKYNPKERAVAAKQGYDPSNKASMSSLFSEVSLPPWNLSGRNTPSTLTQAEGNLRSSKRGLTPGTKSLGRAGGLAFLREGDAKKEANNWAPDATPNATTLSRNASGRGSIRKPALTKAALLRLSAGEKKADEEEKKRVQSEFGTNTNTDYIRQKSVTPNIMTRSAYEYSVPSSSRRERSQSKTPQLSRRSASRSGSVNYRPLTESTNSWQSFQPVARPSYNYYPPTSQRAEPDGLESDDNKDNNGIGQYDHSQEYDPYQTAERQMQELLFGSTSSSKPFSKPAVTMQKPQPVRPSSTSAFSAYVPRNTKQYGDSNYTNDRNNTLGLSQYSRDYSKSKDYGDPVPSNKLVDSKDNMLNRSYSLKPSMTRNWKDIFPSLTRQKTGAVEEGTDNNFDIERAATSIASEGLSLTQDMSRQNQAMARFCHECGNPFPGSHVRFCCECGVKRLYC